MSFTPVFLSFFLLNFLIQRFVVTCLEIYWNYTVPYLEIASLSKCFFQQSITCKTAEAKQP